jgi:hypothetical protein
MASAAQLFAQSNLGQGITGQVTDPTGAAVPRANITVMEQGTGLIRKTVTHDNGNYIVANLPTGKYSVKAEASGFKEETIGNNPLNTDVSIEVNFKLQIGSQADSVTVQADVATVESSSGELGYTVTGEQAGEIQLNGRNFVELLQLLPGVSTTYTDGFSQFSGAAASDSNQSINGGRTNTTTWNLDGADNQDNGSGGNMFVGINPNAIGEFRVLASNFSAEFGTSSGGVVNISIRSGTKDFHGMAYEYWRNDHLQAYAFNSSTAGKPKLRWNNFGGNIGGPVLIPKTRFSKNRQQLFFFLSEDLKYRSIGATNTWTVPTAAVKSGNFGSSTIRDPATQAPYPNNILPASVIDPNMRKLIDIYPGANSGTASFIFNKTTPSNAHQEILKLDYNHSEKDQLSFHWAHDQYLALTGTTDQIEYWRHIPNINTSLQWNHLFSPTLINVAQFSLSGNVINSQKDLLPNPTFIQSFTRQGLGITLPTIYNATQDIPQVAVSGYTTITVTPLSYANLQRIFDWKDSLTKVMGNHTLKAGILVMRSRKNQDSPPAINGQFTFSTTRSPSSGQAMADALLGDFYQYQEYSAVRQGWFRFWQVEPWVQDDWKVNRRLTVNLGLRWSYMQPQYSALNNTVQFLPQYFNPAEAATINPSNGQVVSAPYPYNGLVLDGPGFPAQAQGRVQQDGDPAVQALFHNLPLAGVHTRWGDFAPRLGFAYDLTGRQSTVLRGGFGVAYERINGNYIIGAINNTPFNPVATILNGNVENPNQGATGPVSVQAISASHYLDMKDPRTLTWSLGVQQKLGTNSVLSVSYVGSSAANLSFVCDPNQPPLGYANSVFVPGTKTVANANATRPYPGYGNIQEYDTGANFIYNSLQAQYRKQLSHAGIVSTAFTYASSRTDSPSVGYQPENSYNLRGDWGPSSYGRREVWTSSYVYPLPWWTGGGAWYKQVFGGWQFNGTGLVQSGLPVNISVSNTTGPGTAGDVGSGVRPNLVGDPYSGGPVGGYQVFNPAAFANPATNTFGNLGPYAIYLPRWINLNASMVKSFYVHERYKFDIKFDMYNVANHLSISSVNTGSFNGAKVVNGVTVSNTANWGAESATTPPRTMEASLRLSF